MRCARMRCKGVGTIRVPGNGLLLYCPDCAPEVEQHRVEIIEALRKKRNLTKGVK